MAQASAAETLERASDFGADFATATVNIKAGANVLATHTLAGFTFSNDSLDGLATANEIADATITGAGVQNADSAEITSGLKSYALDIADLNLTTTTYVNGEPSKINSLVARFKA